MDKRQKKRLLIFLLVPVLATLLFISDDLLLRVIIIAVIIIYVAFIIFLRDSVRLDGKYSINEESDFDSEYNIPAASDQDGSFKIITKTNTEAEIITASNYAPEFKRTKQLLFHLILKSGLKRLQLSCRLPKSVMTDNLHLHLKKFLL